MKDEVAKLKGDNLALHSAMGHSGDSVMGQAEVAQHQVLEAQRLLSSILYDIQTNPSVDTPRRPNTNTEGFRCTYFCLREVVVELGSYGTPEWSVMLTSTNTYPYMRVRSKGKPAPNGVYIINEIITKMSVRVNYV